MIRLKHQRLCDDGNLCSFGITEALGGILASGLGGLGLGGAAVGTAAAPGLLATGLAGGLEGAAGGAALSGITGGNPLTGALTGGLTGGAVGGLGPAIGDAAAPIVGADAAPAVGDVAAGIGSGLVGSAVTGQSPLSGAISGAGVGLAAGLGGSPASTPASSPTATPASGSLGGGASAASSALPTDVTAGSSLDLTKIPAGGGLGTGAPPGQPAFTGVFTDVSTPPGGVAGAPSGGSYTPPPSSGLSAADVTPVEGAQDFSGGGGGAIGSGISSLLKNPSVLLGGGLLGLQALKQNQPLPEQQQLEQLAAGAQGKGNQLSSYVFNGTLPPGAQAAVSQASNAAKATARANFAQLGLSGSTQEAEALRAIDQNAAAQTFSMADKLLQQGADYTTLSSDLYQKLLSDTLSQDQAFQQSLGRFAAGLAGARIPGT